MYTIDNFKAMEPMKYYDNPEPKTDTLKQKRQDMIDNKDNLYIATEKHDGDWGMFIHYSKGHNLIRSRSISKVTGAYGDYTAKLPHLCGEMDNWPDNTVVLAEICWDKYGTNANTVGTILRCLPAKAVERQKDKKLSALIFDVLMYKGLDLTVLPYEKRITFYALYLTQPVADNLTPPELYFYPHYFKRTQVFTTDFAAAADDIINRGGEGVVIQKKSNPYMPGTRTAWATLKLKQTLPYMDLKVVGTLEPNKIYDGDCINNWKYWEVDDIILTSIPPQQGHSLYQTEGGANPMWKIDHYPFRAVTKPYFMGWKNGVIVDYNGVNVSVASGLTDDDRAWLATPEAADKIASGELYAVIKAMSENSRASLRHPCLIRLRDDM